MSGPFIRSLLRVGAGIRVTEGNVLGGYKKGQNGRIVSVLRNTFTGEILYRCDMDGPGRTVSLILLESEIEPRDAVPPQPAVRRGGSSIRTSLP